MNVTLGISPCPNDVFIFAGILRERIDTDGFRFTTSFEDVETLNRLAQHSALDVVKISYANFPRIAQNGYRLLNCGGALGRGVGPLLLANQNGEGSVSGFDTERDVWVPGEHTTANFLLDFYRAGCPPVRKRFLAFDALYDELCNTPGAQGVVIHEKRFTYRRDGLTLLQDLGEYWEAKTGYPIPLGAIAARFAPDEADTRIPRLEAVVRRSLDWAYTNPAEAFALCREYAQELSDDVIQAHIDLYVNPYSYDLGTDGQEAVDFFLRQAAQRAEGNT